MRMGIWFVGLVLVGCVWASAEEPTERDPSVLFREGFDDGRLLERGWYDGRQLEIADEAYAGSGCIEYHWKPDTTNPDSSSGLRHLFEPTDTVYLRFYIKLSKGWGWSGRPYHPHLAHFMTTENGKYHGPAASHLTLYIEPQNGRLRLAAQDILNKDSPHGLTQGPLRGGYNGQFYDSEQRLFIDDKWHSVEAMFKLNTLDLDGDKPNADGVVRGWFDGKLVVDRTDVIFRSTDFPMMKFNQFLLTPYFGPGLLPHEQTLWIDELVVSTKRLEGSAAASGPTDSASGPDAQRDRPSEPFLAGNFRWTASQPLVEIIPENLPASPDTPWHAVKDPSIVRYKDRWHLFCTLRKQQGGEGKPPGYIRVGYLSFADWKDAPAAKWRLITLSMDYHGAPQVFYFTPQKKWYLVYQLADSSRDISFGPCYSTTDDISDPASWTLPAPFYHRKPDHVPGWLDFWVICDDEKAHLFFTSLDGRMWRAETKLSDFPKGFGDPMVVLRGDVFEASHTYRLKGLEKYLTLIEAEGQSGAHGRRYYKAYIADRLDGQWNELAASADKPFAGSINVRVSDPRWTDSFSHGELLRAGYDQRLEVDPANLRFLFQGLTDDQWEQGYGRLSWRLGLLEPRHDN